MMSAMPARKRTIIAKFKTPAFFGAPLNSRHTRMPQRAETSVAPCPSAYAIAAPAVPAVTNERSVPVAQMQPPRMPTRWTKGLPLNHSAPFTGSPETGFFIMIVLKMKLDARTPSVNTKNAV